MNAEALESGEGLYGIKWAVEQDYHYEMDREFLIVATRNTGRHIEVDEVCESTDEFDAYLKSPTIAYAQPLFMLVHSGVRVSLGGYNDPWDSGQCGFACLTQKTVEDFGIKPEDYESFLTSLVDEYDAKLIGNVVAYRIWQDETCMSCGHTEQKFLDSCGGFVLTRGWGNMDDFVKENVVPQLKYYEDEFAKAEHQALKGVQSDD
jgi:hypothetical protein